MCLVVLTGLPTAALAHDGDWHVHTTCHWVLFVGNICTSSLHWHPHVHPTAEERIQACKKRCFDAYQQRLWMINNDPTLSDDMKSVWRQLAQRDYRYCCQDCEKSGG